MVYNVYKVIYNCYDTLYYIITKKGNDLEEGTQLSLDIDKVGGHHEDAAQ